MTHSKTKSGPLTDVLQITTSSLLPEAIQVHDLRLRSSHDVYTAVTDLDSVAPQIVRILPVEVQLDFLTVLQDRFKNSPEHYKRPNNVTYDQVKSALEQNPTAMWQLYQLEQLGGQVDVMAYDGKKLVFADMSKQVPEGHGRRNITYVQAMELLQTIGVDMMTRREYRDVLQKLGQFDTVSWVWLKNKEVRTARNHALIAGRLGVGVCIIPNVFRGIAVNLGMRAVVRVKT